MAKKNQKSAVGIKKSDFKPVGKRLDDVKQDGPLEQARLAQFYKEEVVPAMMKKYDYKSVMQVPKLQKICLNMGVGLASQDMKVLESAVNELETIAGQRPVVRKAKKAISNFKLREGMPIGTSVTLRRGRMYEFLDRFINIASPRIRDFRGYSDKSFDGRGNYTLGIKEQIIFPEINVDRVNRITGLDVTFVVSGGSDEEAHSLLTEFGFPFRKRD